MNLSVLANIKSTGSKKSNLLPYRFSETKPFSDLKVTHTSVHGINPGLSSDILGHIVLGNKTSCHFSAVLCGGCSFFFDESLATLCLCLSRHDHIANVIPEIEKQKKVLMREQDRIKELSKRGMPLTLNVTSIGLCKGYQRKLDCATENHTFFKRLKVMVMLFLGLFSSF